MNAQNWDIEEYSFIFGKDGFSSREEEMKLVKLAKRSRESFDELVRKCQGYVIELSTSCFGNYVGHNVRLEDVIQEGNHALFESFINYNYNDATRFTTYAFMRIKWKILNYLRYEFKAEHPVKLEDKHERGHYYRGRLIRFSELSNNENPDVAFASNDINGNGEFKKEFILALKKSMNDFQFSEKEKDIVLSFHGIANGVGNGKRLSFVELGKRHGVCGERIRQIYHKSLSKLRDDKRLEEFYI